MTQPDPPASPLTASHLAADALGVAPIGIPWPHETPARCALEGCLIRQGDPHSGWVPGTNFMDQHAQACNSRVVSGAAAALLPMPVMLKAQRAVFCREGAFSLAKDSHRAWFFLTPPEPPFVAVISTSTLQHLVWRTPLCWSQDLIVFRFGPSVLTVRRPRLLAALDVLREHSGEDRPFVLLDREEKKPQHGRFMASASPALRRQLADLTRGELLALAILAKKTPALPERSDPIRIGDTP